MAVAWPLGWGVFEPVRGKMIGARFDSGLRLLQETVLGGFRQAVAFLYSIGSTRFECVG